MRCAGCRDEAFQLARVCIEKEFFMANFLFKVFSILYVSCQLCMNVIKLLLYMKDPAGWEDVLDRGKINGKCIGCDCDKAVSK